MFSIRHPQPVVDPRPVAELSVRVEAQRGGPQSLTALADPQALQVRRLCRDGLAESVQSPQHLPRGVEPHDPEVLDTRAVVQPPAQAQSLDGPGHG